MISTATDSLSKGWAIDDEVIWLRLWATDILYALLPDDRPRLMVGTAPTCAIRVHDPSNLTSREHAYLERVEGQWSIVDQSKNGLYIDDQPRERFLLAPGMEIGLGRHVTLIAESHRGDFAAANAKAGYSKLPADYTWHHSEEPGKMYLVPLELHDAVKHTGGVATYKHVTGDVRSYAK